MTASSPADLWREANGDRKRYVQLLRDHGLLVDRVGPRCPSRVATSVGSVAQCQNEAGHGGCHFAAVAGFWSDGDDRILLETVREEIHHRVARQRAEDEEQRISARYPTGGVVEGPSDPHDDRIPVLFSNDDYVLPPTAGQRRAALERERQRALSQKAKAHRGQGELVDEMRGQWSERPQ